MSSKEKSPPPPPKKKRITPEYIFKSFLLKIRDNSSSLKCPSVAASVVYRDKYIVFVRSTLLLEVMQYYEIKINVLIC